LTDALRKMELGGGEEEDHQSLIKRMVGVVSDAIGRIPSMPFTEEDAAFQKVEFLSTLLKDARDEMKQLKETTKTPNEVMSASEAKIVPKVFRLVQTSYAVSRRVVMLIELLVSTHSQDLEAKALSERHAALQTYVQTVDLISQDVDEMGSALYTPQDLQAISKFAKLVNGHVTKALKCLSSTKEYHTLPASKDPTGRPRLALAPGPFTGLPQLPRRPRTTPRPSLHGPERHQGAQRTS